MKLVIDANILFAALIKEGPTAELLISDKLQLFAPEFLFTEFSKYEELILKKTHRTKEEFNEFLELLLGDNRRGYQGTRRKDRTL